MDRKQPDTFDHPHGLAEDALAPAGQGGPPFWEEWRGLIPDEEIEFVRIIFEDFCGSWG